jgi:hypothetical protein
MLPLYQSHKQVRAVKIESLQVWPDGSAVIRPAEAGFEAIKVDAAYVKKHEPKAGGYFVVYDDGYRSWSPAEAFEAGYTLVG